MSRTSRAALGVITNYTATIVVALAGFVLVPIVLRYVTREEYGLWTTLGQVFAYLNLLDFGVGSALIRRTAHVRATSEAGVDVVSRALSTAVVIFAGLGVAVLVAGGVFAFVLPRLVTLSASQVALARGLLAVAVLYTALSFPMRAALKTLHGVQQMATANLLTMLEGLLTPLIAVGLLAAGAGLFALPLAAAVAGLLGGGLAFWRLASARPPVRVSRALVSRAEAHELFGWSALLWLNSLAVIVIYQTDHLVVASRLGLEAAAVYALTTRLPLYALPVIVVFADACVPAAVELCAQGRLDRVREVYLRVLRLSGALAVGAAVVACGVNGSFLRLWVGAANDGGLWLTAMAAGILVYRVLMQTAAMVILGVGRLRGVVVMSLLEAALNLGLSLWWARRFGLAGVAAGTLASGVLTSGWFVTSLVARLLTLSPWRVIWSGVGLPLVAAIPAVGVLVLLRQALAVDGWVSLALLAGSLGVVYGVTTLAVGASAAERRELWQWLVHRGRSPAPAPASSPAT